MDEQLLIRSSRKGDLESFNRLVLAYQESLFNTALRILGDDELAADATQEAFISAFRNLSSYRGGSFKAWLMRTVTNACYDELRRQKRRPRPPLNQSPTMMTKLNRLAGWQIQIQPLNRFPSRLNLNMPFNTAWTTYPSTIAR